MIKAENGSFTVEASEFITALEFCPYDGANNLIAIKNNDSITIGSCKFEQLSTKSKDTELRNTDDVFQLVTVLELKVCEVTCLAWSPVSNVCQLPKRVVISTGNHNGTVNVYSTDLKEDTVVSALLGHTSNINCIAFEPLEGQELASVSDDHSCKVWEVETGNLLVSFPLQYPGVSICWHPLQPGNILVAELGGRIRFYDIELKQAILSFDCTRNSLTSADWCWINPSKIGASAELEWFVWDMSKSAYPEDSQQAHSEGCNKLLWSRHNEDVFLTLGRPKNTLKVFHLGHRQPVLQKVHETSMCASWHATLPICAVAGNKTIHFYNTNSSTQQ